MKKIKYFDLMTIVFHSDFSHFEEKFLSDSCVAAGLCEFGSTLVRGGDKQGKEEERKNKKKKRGKLIRKKKEKNSGIKSRRKQKALAESMLKGRMSREKLYRSSRKRSRRTRVTKEYRDAELFQRPSLPSMKESRSKSSSDEL